MYCTATVDQISNNAWPFKKKKKLSNCQIIGFLDFFFF